jgi:hypothetical protein
MLQVHIFSRSENWNIVNEMVTGIKKILQDIITKLLCLSLSKCDETKKHSN